MSYLPSESDYLKSFSTARHAKSDEEFMLDSIEDAIHAYVNYELLMRGPTVGFNIIADELKKLFNSAEAYARTQACKQLNKGSE